jgi:hypothetical protein
MWLVSGLRLVVERIHLRRSAAHAHEDDTLGPAAWWYLRLNLAGGSQYLVLVERLECEKAKTA